MIGSGTLTKQIAGYLARTGFQEIRRSLGAYSEVRFVVLNWKE